LFVEDILESVDKIERYVKGMSYDNFVENEMIIDAVIRNLEVIGEASKNIPETKPSIVEMLNNLK